jgi:hypothetical protein
MSRPPASALITVAVMVVIVTMLAMPLAVSAAGLPMWLDLLARAVFCFWWGVQSGWALIDAAARGQQGKQ